MVCKHHVCQISSIVIFFKLREHPDIYSLGIFRIRKKYISHHLFKRELSEREIAEV